MRLRSVRDVVRNGLCAGCGLCAAIGGEHGARMGVSDRGFLRPADVPLPADVERRILAVCPGIGIDGAGRQSRADPLWGPVRAIHRVHAADPSVRHRGSSGGAVSALAIHLLGTGEIDGVVHFGAGTGDPVAGDVTISRSPAEVLRSAGSRYAPSAPLTDIGALLAGSERFAFIGKPCDVAGLRALARQDPRVDRAFPLMLSFFCAGVPSLEGTRELLARLRIEEREVVDLHYRGEGWPGRFRVRTRGGRVASLSYAESWGEILSRHLQFRCKICPDGTGELADIAAADAWSTADGYPDFEERDGWSALLARTVRGARLVREAADAGALILAPLAGDELEAMQPYQRDRKQALLVRLAALRLAGGVAPRFRGLGMLRAARRSPAKWPRNFAGTWWRVFRRINRE